MTDRRESFLGTSVAFPFKVDESGGLLMRQHEDAIRQSIILIMGTAKGERLMRPTFGCNIHDLVFSVIDTTTSALVAFEVRQSLVKWEPRIEVLDIDVTIDPLERNKLVITVNYRVRSTNNKFNLVYPFYLERSEE